MLCLCIKLPQCKYTEKKKKKSKKSKKKTNANTMGQDQCNTEDEYLENDLKKLNVA